MQPSIIDSRRNRKSEQTDYSKEVESIITSLLESGENGYMYMYVEHLCCIPETITALLIGYTPI